MGSRLEEDAHVHEKCLLKQTRFDGGWNCNVRKICKLRVNRRLNRRIEKRHLVNVFESHVKR